MESAKKKLDEANQLNSQLVNMQEKITTDRKAMEAEKKHLEEVKAYITPKLKEIEEREKLVAADKKDVEEQKMDIRLSMLIQHIQ